jgi:pSer/pThr/pTyr-binding forkhead associated (FHA) protein
MSFKLLKLGNAYALPLDSDTLSELGLDPNDEVEVYVEEGRLVVVRALNASESASGVPPTSVDNMSPIVDAPVSLADKVMVDVEEEEEDDASWTEATQAAVNEKSVWQSEFSGPAKAGPTIQVVAMRDGAEVGRIPFVGGSLILGRDRRADLQLEDRTLSRRHFRLERRGAAFWVVDMESANGTFVNEEQVTSRRLDAGDVIQIGPFEIRVEGAMTADPKMAVVTVEGPSGIHRFGIVGEGVLIGRSKDCDIQIREEGISRRHVSVKLENNLFTVEDQGTSNGTFVDKKRIEGPVKLKAGSRLQICNHHLTLTFLEEEKGKPQNSGQTMLIDQSHTGNAAYMDGEISKMGFGEEDGPTAWAGGKKSKSTGRDSPR